MSSYDYNNAATSGDAAFLEFYPFTTSPTTSSAGAVSPSTVMPVPPTTMSSAMSSPTSSRQPQAISWNMPFDFVAPVAGTAVQSPIEGPMSSPEDSPQTMSPAHISSTASSPNQQLLSPFQGTMDFNAHDSLTAVTLQQNQRQFQSSAALQLHQNNFLQQHRQIQQQQHHQRQLQQQQQQQQQRQQQQQQAQSLQPFVQNPATTAALIAQGFNPYATTFPNPALGYLAQTSATTAALEASIQLGATFHGLPTVTGPGATAPGQGLPYDIGMGNWQDYELVFNTANSLGPHRLGSVGSLGSNSPTGTNIEVHSLGSSEVDWTSVEMFPRFDSFPNGAAQSIFNPGQTLHLRSNSDSSQSEGNSLEYGSFEDISFAPPFSPFSGASDSSGSQHNCFHGDGHNHGHGHGHSHSLSHNNHGHPQHHHRASQELVLSPAAAVSPVPIKTAAASASPTATALIVSTRQSPSAGSGVGPTSSLGSSSSSSTPARRASNGPRKSPIAKPGAKAVVRRSSTGKDGKLIPGEKKVGRRRGPLLPEQRKQASEIRKLRACLRCKFLKKTCDKGEPCAGCQPSHARLWQVPCTRIDIKDVGFFMKDWRADYERHLDVGMSVYNVKGFAKKERLMWITHGYGFCLPVMVREVMVADESCFQLDWVESYLTDQEPIDFGIRTEKLDVGEEGISMEKLSTYLDHHIDGTFETFVDDHFEGTPFVTEVLKTAHRYYIKEKQSVIRKALKLVLAYNLTMHITLVEQQGSENPIDGQIDDEDSKYFGKTVAPVMINFQIKCAMADMWRELQKEILEELSGLYSRVYSGDRLKNWPTIFMLAAILLIVWEEMQFDCHYRVPDINSVQKFCGEMEGTPVGVIVGLFHAISQKLPAFTDWDTEKHGQVLNNNEAVCEAMTDMRQHIAKHDTYLRSRQNNTEFDRHDFDSLSNKFLSKLVIRAN
ncbi:c6 finger domain-containing protein [Ophiostoma piceae UAMH 11346]|uniref:C6 finger domain-containing protein n=1 Tax=Ophiostoma piceae (strain UAMH 11346) TaxID=1262450 RepID=S3CB01_OPHP1|nr:c6 finger domain-containing protein [Ophiostoma piceae UAMH 11346]